MSGYEVRPEELRTFAGKMDAHCSNAGGIAGLVQKSDVGDKSWGMVGLFVKDNYTTMLTDLNDLFTALQEGLQSGADKFRGTAQSYEDLEKALADVFGGIQTELDR